MTIRTSSTFLPQLTSQPSSRPQRFRMIASMSAILSWLDKAWTICKVAIIRKDLWWWLLVVMYPCVQVHLFTCTQELSSWKQGGSSCRDYHYNASPHTLQYSCLDNLRVLPFMSAEHDVRVKTLLPKGANWTNLYSSWQDRCRATDSAMLNPSPSIDVCSGRNTAPTHTFIIITRACARLYAIASAMSESSL